MLLVGSSGIQEDKGIGELLCCGTETSGLVGKLGEGVTRSLKVGVRGEGFKMGVCFLASIGSNLLQSH